jgi:hypothetical protein
MLLDRASLQIDGYEFRSERASTVRILDRGGSYGRLPVQALQ